MNANAKPVRLGDWLLEEGHVNASQLDLALREQKRKGTLLGEALIHLGFVSQKVLASFLAKKTQSERIELTEITISQEVLRLIPESIARRLAIVPLSVEEGVLTVAIADPLNVTAFDTIEQITGLQANLVSAAEDDIRAAIDRHYTEGQTVEDLISELLQLGAEKLASTTEQDAPMIRLVARVIAQAVNSGSSDIHVQPEEKVLRVRFRQDGILDAGALIPKELQPALIARLKILGKLDIAENRRPQSGRCTTSVGSRQVDLRLSCLPTHFGESLVLRILDRESLPLGLGMLGFAQDYEHRFKQLLGRAHGVILVTGPTGSGKTTTLYAALSQINAVERSIFTLEDPIEYKLPLIRQTQIHEAVGLTFSEGLKTLLRQDPDVMLIGETRDTETAQLMVRAALTGHLVFSTLHTNDAHGAIPRLLDLGVEPYLLAPTLLGVIGQRLVRRLCPQCRVEVPNPEQKLAKLGVQLPSDLPQHLWAPGGCDRCKQSGYAGRTSIHELLVLTPQHQTAMLDGMNMNRLREISRADGFRTLFEDGLLKAIQGVTSVEEILRVTNR